jgi:hypothetical protein
MRWLGGLRAIVPLIPGSASSRESLQLNAVPHRMYYRVLQHLLDVVVLAPGRLVGDRSEFTVFEQREMAAPAGEDVFHECSASAGNRHEVRFRIEVGDRSLGALVDPGK